MTGKLHLNGQEVGEVLIRGWHGAWGMGEFRPSPAFAPFAPLFAEWARLMRADGPARLSAMTAQRLRELEFQLYAIHARLFIVEAQQWREIAILNIDEPLIEWKETWTRGANNSLDHRTREGVT